MVNVFGSLAGAVAIVVAGLALWVYLERKQGKDGGAV